MMDSVAEQELIGFEMLRQTMAMAIAGNGQKSESRDAIFICADQDMILKSKIDLKSAN
jgi:hypothetical protein